MATERSYPVQKSAPDGQRGHALTRSFFTTQIPYLKPPQFEAFEFPIYHQFGGMPMKTFSRIFATFLLVMFSLNIPALATTLDELFQQQENSPVDAASPTERFQQAEQAAIVLEKNWDTFGDVSFWIRGCMVESLINYIAAAYAINRTPDNDIVLRVKDQLLKWPSIEKKLDKNNEDFDDRLWWAMVFIRYYEVIDNNRDLLDNKAAFIFKDRVVEKNAYDDFYEGGVWWQYAPKPFEYPLWKKGPFPGRQKTAVTNSLFLMIAARLALHYNKLGDTERYNYFLEWANKEANWLRNHTPYDIWGRSVSPVGDALEKDGEVVIDIWTYNQGLYTIAMADYAELIKDSWPLQLAVDHWNGYYKIIWPDGVLRELVNRDNPSGYPRTDLMVFKGLATRHWMYAYDRIKAFSSTMASQISSVVRNSADRALANGNQQNKFGFYWEKSDPFKWNAATQSSAVDLLSAAVMESTK
ncbi:MAG: glycoside hydrolase family 76 protein [Deltaproteobacteria bacterium]|jgi:Glycosyl hydrolase family 76